MLYLLLFGSGILLGFTGWSRTIGQNELIPICVFAIILAAGLLMSVLRRQRERAISEQRAEDALRDVQYISLMRREAKAKIPKNCPRRESKIARDGMVRLSAARSMAVLVRKPRLREEILWICDFADLVLETIRRMPEDTPAAVAFIENHLVRLQEALEQCFEIYRARDYKKATALDAEMRESECFGGFIAIFCKQQDSILFEGLDGDRNRGILA